jgi:hypothetical protein
MPRNLSIGIICLYLPRRHGVLQLLYSQLQQCAADLIPPAQLQRLQKYFQENSARNVLLTAELRRLIELLESASIEAVPYKGPVLALFAYGDVSLRRFVDLDVLVRKEHVSRAIDLLLTDGYEFSKPLSLSQRELLLRTQHNLQLRRDKRQLIVELHWEVASNLFASSVQADDLWSCLSEIKLNQANIKTLNVEGHALLIVCTRLTPFVGTFALDLRYWLDRGQAPGELAKASGPCSANAEPANVFVGIVSLCEASRCELSRTYNERV